MKQKDPIPTVDLIIRKDSGKPREILIEKRGRPPYRGQYSLPGGHVEYGETVEQAALRELREETSITATLVGILGVYSDPKRDPRGQRISTVFIGNSVEERSTPKGADDAESAEWMDLDEALEKSQIAFDHRLILEDYRRFVDSTRDSLGHETFWSSKER